MRVHWEVGGKDSYGCRVGISKGLGRIRHVLEDFGVEMAVAGK